PLMVLPGGRFPRAGLSQQRKKTTSFVSSDMAVPAGVATLQNHQLSVKHSIAIIYNYHNHIIYCTSINQNKKDMQEGNVIFSASCMSFIYVARFTTPFVFLKNWRLFRLLFVLLLLFVCLL